MRTLTVEKIGETEKAVQYRVTFWIVENPGHPVCWEGKEYYFGRWLPKPVVRELREFTVKGHTIMAYSRKDAITRLKLQKKI